jgi:hypothetical protein
MASEGATEPTVWSFSLAGTSSSEATSEFAHPSPKADPRAPAPAGSCWTSSSIVSQDEKSLGMIVLLARCTASTNVVSPDAA